MRLRTMREHCVAHILLDTLRRVLYLAMRAYLVQSVQLLLLSI